MRKLIAVLLLTFAVAPAAASANPSTSIARPQTIKLLRGDGHHKKGVIRTEGARYASWPFCTFEGSQITKCVTYLHFGRQCDDAHVCKPVPPARWVSTTHLTSSGRYSTEIHPESVPRQHVVPPPPPRVVYPR